MHCEQHQNLKTANTAMAQWLNTHTQQEALVFFDGAYATHEANDHDKCPCDNQQVGS